MIELSLAEWFTAALLSLTCALLVIASNLRGDRWRHAVAITSMVIGTAASFALYKCYRGEADEWFFASVQEDIKNNAGKPFITFMRNGAFGGTVVGVGSVSRSGSMPAAAASDSGGSDGHRREEAQLAGSESSSWWFGPPTRKRAKLNLTPFADCADCPEMVPLEPGYAALGADKNDLEALAAERPQRVVRIGKPFAIGRTEITVAQFEKYLKLTNRTHGCAATTSRDPNHPADCVTYAEAQAYAAWLSEYTGQTYRLPSAGEWEYAARAKSATPYIGGTKPAANTADAGNRGTTLMPVASFEPNGFGLNDMSGNVAEWTADCWLPSLHRARSDGSWTTRGADCTKRVVKDGAWSDEARFTRVSSRRPMAPAMARPGVGFRLVREIRLTH